MYALSTFNSKLFENPATDEVNEEGNGAESSVAGRRGERGLHQGASVKDTSFRTHLQVQHIVHLMSLAKDLLLFEVLN